MVSLTQLFLYIFVAPALCRVFSLPTTRVNNAPSHPLQINFLAGPTQPGTAPELELLAARRALQKIKTLIGPAALKALFASEIASGTAEWHAILSSAPAAHDNASDPDPGTRVLAEVVLTAVPADCAAVPGFNAVAFAGWFAATAFGRVETLWAGHPEHYFIDIGQNGDGTLAAELVEPWGPVLTHSRVPRLAPVTGQPGGGVKKAWMKAREGFPVQTVGEEVLMDGSGAVVGDLHYSFRDLPERKGRMCGIEMALDMWMPSGTPEEVKEGISQHLAIEYYNWVGWAFEDIQSGAYVPA